MEIPYIICTKPAVMTVYIMQLFTILISTTAKRLVLLRILQIDPDIIWRKIIIHNMLI